MNENVSVDIQTLFEQLKLSLPRGCATLEMQQPKNAQERLQLILVPSNPRAAAIEARVPGCLGVDLHIGQGTTLEVSLRGKHYTGLPFLEEVRSLCIAVINGKFEEELWLVSSKVIKSKSKIEVQGKTIKMLYRGAFHLFAKKQHRFIRYSPYCGGAEQLEDT